MNYNTSEECCHLKHISKIGKSDKIEILRYYNSIPNESQKTEYLKSMITEIDIIQRSGSIKPRQSNYEYFVNIKDENDSNNLNRAQVCVKAFLTLHKIKYSRLRRKVLKNRSETEYKTGKHNIRPNKIPLEVELDIREFLENYPSRESHYNPRAKTGRKYIESDKNMKSLFREFINNYNEYEDYVK
jgi:hypothetical protein